MSKQSSKKKQTREEPDEGDDEQGRDAIDEENGGL
jgi:hypothetical protein